MKNFLIIFLVIIPQLVFSQVNEVKIPTDEFIALNNRMGILQDSIRQLDSINNVLIAELNGLKKENRKLQKELELDSIAASNDSVKIMMLNSKIEELTNSLDNINNQHSNDVYMANVRIAATRLSIKYDSTKVQDAIHLFDSIPDSSPIKQKYIWVRELLVKYGAWNKEFKNIIEAAQINTDAERHNRFSYEKFHNSVVLKIKNMDYYNRAYGKNHNVPYLDNMIDKAKQSINKEDKEVNYHDVLIGL